MSARDPLVAVTLVEAFREVGPLVEIGPGVDPEWARAVNAQRSAAAECLQRKLQRLVGRLRFQRADLEEAAQEVLLRLVARGPRGIREGDPEADGQVVAYLQQSLKNNTLDLIGWGASQRWRDVPELDFPDPRPRPDSPTHDVLARQLLQDARQRLVDEIVPEVMAGLNSEEKALSFAKAFATLCDLATGQIDSEKVLEEEIRSGPRRKRRAGVAQSGRKPRTERDAAQDRLDQRFKRTLDVLRRGVVAHSLAQGLDKSRVKALEQVVGDLDRRPGREV